MFYGILVPLAHMCPILPEGKLSLERKREEPITCFSYLEVLIFHGAILQIPNNELSCIELLK